MSRSIPPRSACGLAAAQGRPIVHGARQVGWAVMDAAHDDHVLDRRALGQLLAEQLAAAPRVVTRTRTPQSPRM